MKSMPIPQASTARRLPGAKVQQIMHRQAVDLKPEGNTVAIRTISDNPLEENRPVTVVTQASGGIASAPDAFQSRSLSHSFMPGIGSDTYTTTVAKYGGGTVLAGMGNGLNGLGEEEAPNGWDKAIDLIKTAGQTYADIETSGDSAKIEAAKARAIEAQEQAKIAQANADVEKSRLMAAMNATNASIGGFKFNVPLLVGGAALLGLALYMKSKKGKK